MSSFRGNGFMPNASDDEELFMQPANSSKRRQCDTEPRQASPAEPDLPNPKRVRINDTPSSPPRRISPRKHANSHPTALRQAHLAPPKLPKSDAYWSKKKLLIIENNPNDWTRIQIRCAQPDCTFIQYNKDRYVGGSGNLIRHYQRHHKHIPASEQEANEKAAESQPSVEGFYGSEAIEQRDKRFRSLLLDFFIKNNLSFRVVDQSSFKDLLRCLSATVIIPSSKSLVRDLEGVFEKGQRVLSQQLAEHVNDLGRVSLTTDCWSAMNKKEFMAITVHIVDKKTWKNISWVLDIIELIEPIHSGHYLCEELLKVTDYYDITKAVFTITHDNAGPNDTLLREFEAKVEENYQGMNELDQAKYMLRFKISFGSIRCCAHVLNLAVQDG
jgi:hypothetical protein